ncbi:acyl carrier protein, partial [Salmonella enterica]|nr:acyl carrier protein [Salmonella enterica]EBX5402302.1 acyl carrier protein [Salmonella enterica subsp. enterica serovar Java]ECC3917746.1 acyl carrier protein [Salmonella enterica subsp. diarizonae]EBE1093033.1 acyl carrier protein [Salmonella enterica]EHM9592200.1 acyl carrier protein [Salmonella enterica subsp. enterica serovar Java]
ESGGEGQTEEAMTALWEQILGCRITDRSRSFFELGGDSLKLLQLQKVVRSRLHREVTIAELFRYPSVRDLCSHIFGETQSGNQLSRADHENELFMSKIDQINNYEAAEVRKELANVLKELNQEDEL